MASTNIQTVTLSGYSATVEGGANYLVLGTWDSYGIEQLQINPGPEWTGLTITATFVTPNSSTRVVVPASGLINVPPEATAQALTVGNPGVIVFSGVSDGVQRISTNAYYVVSNHAPVEGDAPAPTPDEFQQFVDAVKADADRAAQAAADAEAAVQRVTNAGTLAVTDIGNAKDSALEAIDAAREEAAGSISADVEGAKQAAADAEQSAADAEQSAKNAADALANVQAAGQSALDDIATERQNTLSDIQNEGSKQQSAVAGAGTAALEAIGQTEQAAINQIKQTGETQVGAVQSAGTTQISQINSAGAAQVQAVKDEGAAQTSALDDAAAAHKTELEAIASHPPQPNTATGKWQVWNAETGAYQDTDALYQGGYYTPAVSDDGVLTWQGSQAGMPSLPSANIKGPKGDKGDPGLGVPTPTTSDAGKVPVVNAEGTGYELGDPQVDAYTKAESDARYAPIEAAINVSGTGTGMVSLSPTVGWGMQGLKFYGRSWQDGTPSVEQEVPIQSAGKSGTVDVQITDGGGQSQQLHIPTPDGLPGIPVTSGGNWVDESGQQWVSDVVDLAAEIKTQNVYALRVSDYLDGLNRTGNPHGDTYYITTSDVSILTIPSKENSRLRGMLCNYFEAGLAYSSEANFDVANIGINGRLQNIRFCFGPVGSMPTLEDAKAWFEAHDVIVMYPLATPITTPLDADTIAAYRALQSYPGTTNVLAPDAGIEASALADPNQYIEDRIQAAITQAVKQAMTLTGGTT